MGAKLSVQPFAVDVFADELTRVEAFLGREAEGFEEYAERIVRTENREAVEKYVKDKTGTLQSVFPRLNEEELRAIVLYTMELRKPGDKEDTSYNIYSQMNKAFARREWLWSDTFRDCFFWVLSGLRGLPRATSRLLFRGGATR